MVHFLGIRHHGPGCARSLVRALEELSPEALLIEGPPEAEALLALASLDDFVPPVALLLYGAEDARQASFYPLAEFSPEWQALCYAGKRRLPVRFIDLPMAHDLALRDAPSPEEATADKEKPETQPDEAEPDPPAEIANEPDVSSDPLDWLGRAAGYGDGETWWNRLVEERQNADGLGLFAAIAEAMTAVRAEVPRRLSAAAQHREELREAHMRKCLRQAEKEGWEKVAVVCGAWHVPALTKLPPAKSDNDLLKGLPKVKVAATWTPWTYGRLASASGYGAGIDSPGWYEFLWRNQAADGGQRSVRWLSKVARLLRDEGIDCSSAHVIEAARLGDTLAAFRDHPAAGLEELNEAVRAVICMGDDAPLRLVRSKLIIGEKLGRVPDSVPAVPLQQDLERQQKRLRLKPEALVRTLDLDLRNATDLERSHLLHRLGLLHVGWGEIKGTGHGAKGTFHEVWQLQWDPTLVLTLIEASRWGQTVSDAAAALAIDRASSATTVGDLAALVDKVLLANLPEAVEPVALALENLAAVSADPAQLLDAIPPLANIHRYGNVRQTDAGLVGHVLDGLVARVCIGLSAACSSLDDEAARAMRARIVAVHQAIRLIGQESHRTQWRPALRRLAVLGGTHGLLSGLTARLLFDEIPEEAEATALRMSQALSSGNEPAAAAAWLEGFLHQSGLILLHDDRLWSALDAWVASLTGDHFLNILPLVRRTFTSFPASERTQLGERARHAGSASAGRPAAALAEWNPERARQPVPVLRALFGLSP